MVMNLLISRMCQNSCCESNTRMILAINPLKLSMPLPYYIQHDAQTETCIFAQAIDRIYSQSNQMKIKLSCVLFYTQKMC